MSAKTASSPSAVLLRLRNETETEHRSIERAINLPKAVSSIANYAALLEGFYGFYSPYEERLLNNSLLNSLGVDFNQRLKSDMLADDLRTLGRDSIANVPLCNDLPDTSSLPLVWGSLYVLEGSTLGGQIISRMLARELGISNEAGGRFFHGYGARTGEMWTAFGAALTAYAQDVSSHEAIIGAARETFQKLQLWLERPSVNHE